MGKFAPRVYRVMEELATEVLDMED